MHTSRAGPPVGHGVAYEHDGGGVTRRHRPRHLVGGLSGRGHGPRLPRPPPSPTTTITSAALGRLAAPRSGRGVGACTRPTQRSPSTMATTQVNGTDETPAGPPRRRVPMALVTWVFVALILLIVVVLLVVKITRGSTTVTPPPGGPGRLRCGPRRHLGPERGLRCGRGRSSPTTRARRCCRDSRRCRSGDDRRWSTWVRSSAPTARRSGGPWWPRSVGSGPSPTSGPPRRRTPRSSRALPPSPSTGPSTGAPTSPLPPSRNTVPVPPPRLRPAFPSSVTRHRWSGPSSGAMTPSPTCPGPGPFPSSTWTTGWWSRDRGSASPPVCSRASR